ncbi:MAG TPA: hypothetical protein VIH22_09195 [Cyclobacteriaceae bacterium]
MTLVIPKSYQKLVNPEGDGGAKGPAPGRHFNLPAVLKASARQARQPACPAEGQRDGRQALQPIYASTH